MITMNDIDARRRAVPFENFWIVLSSGSYYDIYHLDMIWLTRRTAYVGIYLPNRPEIPERAALLSILHVTKLQELPTPAPT
jgi:hypothetical protein